MQDLSKYPSTFPYLKHCNHTSFVAITKPLSIKTGETFREG